MNPFITDPVAAPATTPPMMGAARVFITAAPPFAPGDRLIGCFARGAGLVLAGFAISRG